jgi:hypothetical protein
MDPGPNESERDRFNNPYDNRGILKPTIADIMKQGRYLAESKTQARKPVYIEEPSGSTNDKH